MILFVSVDFRGPSHRHILLCLPVKTVSWGVKFLSFRSTYLKHLRECRASWCSLRSDAPSNQHLCLAVLKMLPVRRTEPLNFILRDAFFTGRLADEYFIWGPVENRLLIHQNIYILNSISDPTIILLIRLFICCVSFACIKFHYCYYN